LPESDYLVWNHTIVDALFSQENAGKSVYVAVTRESIERLSPSGAEAGLQGFLRAIRSGPPWTTSDHVCRLAYESYTNWRDRGLPSPPYVAYLGLFVLAAGVEGEFAPHAYYPRLRSLLDLPPGGALAGFDRMWELWFDLERWSNHDLNGELGVFKAQWAGSWIHVGLPVSQTLLSERERRALPSVFADAGLAPQTAPTDSELARAVRLHGPAHLRRRTRELLLERKDKDLCAALLEAIEQEFAEWDGHVPSESPVWSEIRPTRGSLRLCINFDPIALTAALYFRARIAGDFPEDGLFLGAPGESPSFQCDEFLPAGSSPLLWISEDRELVPDDIDLLSGEVLSDDRLDWLFAVRGAPVRSFALGRAEGLPHFVESSHIPAAANSLVLYHESCGPEMDSWLHQTAVESIIHDGCRGLPDGWRLAQISGLISLDSPPVVVAPLIHSDRVRLRLLGGVRVSRGNSFFPFAPPSIEVVGGAPDSTVLCNEEPLPQNEETPERYSLPDGLPLEEKVSISVISRGVVACQRFLFLSSGIHDPRGSGQWFDCWGAPLDGTSAAECRLVGPVVDTSAEFPEEPSPAPYLVRELQNPNARSIIYLGRRPGQLFKSSKEEIPEEWSPIWAVSFPGRKGFAAYCGDDLSDAFPMQMPVENRKLVSEWKNVLWQRRKRIEPPKNPMLGDLWREYQRVARRA